MEKNLQTISLKDAQALPIISVIMGSNSDYPIMKLAFNILNELEIEAESLIISAHRTPDRLYSFAKGAEQRGIKVIIAGAGGAAHLPGMVASLSNIPVLGVPIISNMLGLDSLLSIVQMPKGTPVATFGVGEAGAQNAAIFAIEILALYDKNLKKKLLSWKEERKNMVALYPTEQL